MKKTIIYFLFAFATLTIVSCGKKEKTDATIETTSEHEHAVAYHCPMDCEKGKTYDKAGTCPVCEMDLVEIESHEGHEHE